MIQQDPFRQNAASATDDDLTALVETGPVSDAAGRRAVYEESQITDRVIGGARADFSDAVRASPAFGGRRFEPGDSDRLTPEQANERYGVDNYLTFDKPVSPVSAAEMHRQAVLRRFREETAARADLSALDSIGAAVVGGATDPVLLPTWFIGGGAAAVRGLGIATRGGRAAGVVRGAAVGVIDGTLGGVAAESINAAARLNAGEDYTGGDALRNILFGAALGAGIGGTVGAIAPEAPRRTGRAAQVANLIGDAARRRGENPATALRIAEIESGLNPAADNPASSASGVFQFLTGQRSAWRAMGGGDPFDASLNVSRGVELLAENRTGLRRQLGREPQEWELYLAHQQGQGGAFQLLRDPNRPAVDALRAAGVADPDAAIRLNGGRDGMTAGQFAGKWRRKFGEGGGAAGPTIEAMTPDRPPRPLDGLSDNERVGAFTESLEAIANDAPVDLGAMLARTGLDALDETSAVPSIRGRWLEADTAVTRRGSEIPVRFAVVELADLKTSHTDDLYPEADYPAALQPRDRTRAGSQAANFELERDLNPALLMRDRAASGGAPIISPDGLVESGNGRTIALRRSALTGPQDGSGAWGRYQAELARSGVDVTGFDRPVLVRMRAEPMTGAGRADMARELNLSQTEGFSPVEQAKADARRLDAATLGLLDGDDAFAAANRPFLRGFVARVAPNDVNAITDAAGAISLSGKARVQAALVQAAYGDDAVTAALFESADANIRAIGQALADAAPAWARMRATAPAGLDITRNLTGAVALVREARASRMSVGELLGERLGQADMFGGQAISPETEALLHLMFRDDGLTRPRGAERMAEALKDYARTAADTPAGPDLFGETPNGRAFLDTLIKRYGDAEGDGQRGLAYAGGGEPGWTTREAEPAGLDLRPAEPIVGRSGGDGARPDGGSGVEDVGRSDVAERLKSAGVEGVAIAPAVGHGPVLTGLEGRWADTVTALKTLQDGDVRGALSHPAVGAIDMVWGRPPTTPQKSDGWGLAKLLNKHPDVIADLPERLARMSVTQVLPDRINLASDADRAAVRLDWDGEAKTWLVTAFAKDGKGGRPGGDSSVSAALEGPAPSPDRPTKASIAETATQGERLTPEARVAAIIAGDPELKALLADTEALARANGVEMPAFERSTEPSTIAEAIRAAALCLATEFGA